MKKDPIVTNHFIETRDGHRVDFSTHSHMSRERIEQAYDNAFISLLEVGANINHVNKLSQNINDVIDDVMINQHPLLSEPKEEPTETHEREYFEEISE